MNKRIMKKQYIRYIKFRTSKRMVRLMKKYGYNWERPLITYSGQITSIKGRYRHMVLAKTRANAFVKALKPFPITTIKPKFVLRSKEPSSASYDYFYTRQNNQSNKALYPSPYNAPFGYCGVIGYH